ncbi:MAG TPA: M13 family metallopeptidase [Thermoanaerobaculia bacterium]|nr:M13 family metallopeptidase [Thermoanaerobaculia bacterium]
MKRLLLSTLLLSACTAATTTPPAAAPPATTAAAQPVVSTLEFDRANLDTTANACNDFYQYANGGWLAKNPIPPQYTAWGMMSSVSEDNRRVLREILEAAAQKPASSRTAVEQKIGDFYSSCMNEQQIDAAGLAPIQPELDRIAAIASRADLQNEIVRLHNIGVAAPFVVHATQDAKNSTETIAEVSQAGLGLPDRDYYFRTDDKSKKVREEYVAHINKMFELAKVPGDADAVMRIENALANASFTAVQLRDPQTQYNRMPVSQLTTLAPSLVWDQYLAQRGLSIDSINVAQPSFVKEVDHLIATAPLSDWQTYLRWQLLTDVAGTLPTPIADENFRFRNTVLLGQKKQQDRWQRCVARVNAQVGEALGQAYVDRKFPPEAKKRAMELVDNLVVALRENIGQLDWMSSSTRANALAKLNAFRRKIGYPDTWRDYSKLTIVNGPLATNTLAATQFEVQRDLAKIGKPVDLTEWYMTPPTINAYYNPPYNEIVFPAGILQWPMFDIHQDDAFNYGAVGSVIGHELTHGFDDEGSQYDAKGNLANWWTEEDKKNFEARAECIVNQFEGYYIEPETHHTGKLVAGESIADLGGAIIAYKAWQKSLVGKPKPQTIGGFTPEQRFFLGFARARATNMTIESARNRVLTDPHPINKFRVNGPLSNMPQFASAFQCHTGDPMVRATQCAIW